MTTKNLIQVQYVCDAQDSAYAPWVILMKMQYESYTLKKTLRFEPELKEETRLVALADSFIEAQRMIMVLEKEMDFIMNNMNSTTRVLPCVCE